MRHAKYGMGGSALGQAIGTMRAHALQSDDVFRVAVRGACLLTLGMHGLASAQEYPSKAIRVVVPYAPGGGSDIGARLLSSKLAEFFGQQVIVENRPGGGTNIGMDFVAKAAADGYTLLYGSPSLTVNPSLYKKLNFDPVKDFAPISVFTSAPNILVVNIAFPAKTLKEFVAIARARPGAIDYSTSGSGSSQHLAGELFKLRTGLNIVHVPFKGTAPAITSLVGGEVATSFSNVAAISGYVKAGRLRGLGSTGPKRSSQMPEVPTMKEQGVDMEVIVWWGLLAPVGTPAAIVGRLSDAIAKIAMHPDTAKRLRDLGNDPVGGTPEQFAAQIRDEIPVWAKVVKAAAMVAD